MNLVLTLLVVGVLVFTAVKIVPVYVTNYQFNDAMMSEARFALSGYSRKTEDDIREDIWKEMQKDGIPGKREDIHVIISGSLVNISLDYSVAVDLKVYQLSIPFHSHADNHTI